MWLYLHVKTECKQVPVCVFSVSVIFDLSDLLYVYVSEKPWDPGHLRSHVVTSPEVIAFTPLPQWAPTLRWFIINQKREAVNHLQVKTYFWSMLGSMLGAKSF